jgi:hypothetical protein
LSAVGFPFAFATGPAREFLTPLVIAVILATKSHVVTKEVVDRLFQRHHH